MNKKIKILIFLFLSLNILYSNNNFCYYIDKNNIKKGELIINFSKNNQLQNEFLNIYNDILNNEKNFYNNKTFLNKFNNNLVKFEKVLKKLKEYNKEKILKNPNIDIKYLNKNIKYKLLKNMANLGHIRYKCLIKNKEVKYNLLFKINNIENKIKNIRNIIKNKNKLSSKDINNLKNNLIFIKEVVFTNQD